MKAMTEDRTNLKWAALATAIRAAREARGLSQEALAALAGVSEGSVQNLESGKPRTRIPPTLAKIEPHLGWAGGSGRIILDGGEPIPAPAADDAPVDPRDSQDPGKLRQKYSLRIVSELESDDPLLDSAVIPLPGTPGVRMTVIVHGTPEATPEQIQEALLAWRKAEEKLQRLPDGDDDDDEPRAANGS